MKTYSVFLVMILTFLTALTAFNAEQRGLIGYWNLDEGKGSVAQDSSGYKNDGTLVNGPEWKEVEKDKFSQKKLKILRFDGTKGQKIEVPHSSSFATITNSVTIEARVNPTNLDARVSVISFVNGDIRYGLSISPDASIRIHYSSGNNLDTPNNVIKVNQWTHIIGTGDGEKIGIYINGEAVTEVKAGKDASAPMPANAARFVIGGTQDNSDWFTGMIDEVKLYNYELTADWVKEAFILSHHPELKAVKEYAPILWLANDERLHPMLPYPFAFDNIGEDLRNPNEVSMDEPPEKCFWQRVVSIFPGESTELKWLSEKINKLEKQKRLPPARVIYYTNPEEELKGTQVYQYWFYYLFDEGIGSHRHDSEHAFVFVKDGEVRGVVGAGHTSAIANNILVVGDTLRTDRKFPRSLPQHMPILVELGKHASAPDRNLSGRFDLGMDANVFMNYAWGSRDVMTSVDATKIGEFKFEYSYPREEEKLILEKSLHNELEKSLHNNKDDAPEDQEDTISDKLREIMKRKNLKTYELFPLEDMRYLVELLKEYKADKFLFSLDPSSQEDLDSKNISEPLRQKFEENKISLSVFKINEQSLENLKSEGVSDEVLKKLEKIKNKVTEEKKKFVDLLNKTMESFKITEQSLENLKSEGVPDDVLEKLQSLKNQEFTREKDFLDKLEETIGEEQTVRLLILKHAKTIGEEQTVKFKTLILKHASTLSQDTTVSVAETGTRWHIDYFPENKKYVVRKSKDKEDKDVLQVYGKKEVNKEDIEVFLFEHRFCFWGKEKAQGKVEIDDKAFEKMREWTKKEDSKRDLWQNRDQTHPDDIFKLWLFPKVAPEITPIKLEFGHLLTGLGCEFANVVGVHFDYDWNDEDLNINVIGKYSRSTNWALYGGLGWGEVSKWDKSYAVVRAGVMPFTDLGFIWHTRLAYRIGLCGEIHGFKKLKVEPISLQIDLLPTFAKPLLRPNLFAPKHPLTY